MDTKDNENDASSLYAGEKKTVKMWYIAKEVFGLPDMPTTERRAKDALERATANNPESKRKRQGTKAFEYHVSCLPERAQQQLVGFNSDRPINEQVDVKDVIDEKSNTPYSITEEFKDDDKVSETYTPYFKHDVVKIPQYNVKASAGGGLMVGNENIIGQISVGKDWIYKQGLANLNLALIEVSGDSMEPTLSDGDLAMISLIKPNCTDTVEGIHIFSIDGEVRIKRLTRDLSKRGYHLRSDNQLYGNDYIEESELHRMNIIGKLQKVLKGVK